MNLKNQKDHLHVVIDNGHGGILNGKYLTPGKRWEIAPGKWIYEGDINRKIASYFNKKINEISGLKPITSSLLVNTVADVSLTKRKKRLENIAALNIRQGHHMFCLSIHCNAYEKDTDVSGTETHYWGNLWRSSIIGKRMAPYFTEFVSEEFKSQARCDKKSNYKILRAKGIVVLLVECGFMTNQTEADKLMKTSYQKRIARGLAKAVEFVYDNGLYKNE